MSIGLTMRMGLASFVLWIPFDCVFAKLLVTNFPDFASHLGESATHFSWLVTEAGVAAAFVLAFISLQGNLPSTPRIIRRQALLALGSFDPSLKAVEEDEELTKDDIASIKTWIRDAESILNDLPADRQADAKSRLNDLRLALMLEVDLVEGVEFDPPSLKRIGLSNVTAIYMQRIGFFPNLERQILMVLLAGSVGILLLAHVGYLLASLGIQTYSLSPFVGYVVGAAISVASVVGFLARVWPVQIPTDRFAPIVQALQDDATAMIGRKIAEL